jgi:hypothetical protein
VVVITEGYATAATIAKHGKVPALAAYDSGNLLSVATALHQRYPDKAIIIAGDDDHRIENNPGREKALAADEAVAGVAICPNFSAEQRAKGLPGRLGLNKPSMEPKPSLQGFWECRSSGSITGSPAERSQTY